MRNVLSTCCLAITVVLLVAGCMRTRTGMQVIKVGEQSQPLGGGGLRIDRPRWEAGGRLGWDGSPVAAPGADICTQEGAGHQRLTRLLEPRVDEVRCARAGTAGLGGNESFLVGFDAQGQLAWKRRLGLESGKYTFDEAILGASREGIVLSNLTVVSPWTGETLVLAPTHPVDLERRPVPDYEFSQSALYLSERGAFVLFEADVTLVRSEGGLYLLEPRRGQKELLLGVATTWGGSYWRVEEMLLSESRRYLILAQNQATRGKGGVSFSIYDLQERRLVFEEKFGEQRYSRDPKLVLGKGGDVGFSYVDETGGRVVLVHYRLTG
ncbi:hypothetical protein [Cystobacter fuscus]|uniref:hypothetical protein n=1 Tax=Cystobacter fuscus TaxID=43 RepID=UPI002B302603|nr:hypothetical protein F0U63_44895 [Cystobacter fuscus]